MLAAQAARPPAGIRWRRAGLAMAVAAGFALVVIRVDLRLAAPFAAYMALHMLALAAAFERVLQLRWRGLRALLALEAVSVALALLVSLFVFAFQDRLPRPPDEPRQSLGGSLADGISTAQFLLGFFALAYVFPYAADDARLRALEAQRLAATADLARLRAHLEPHFLLNTLNAVAGLVSEDPREARRLLACLGDLLRDGLRDGSELQSVSEQLEWLRRYSEILLARHRGRLQFDWRVQDGVGGVLLPRLLLQPLVENAVQHGALRRAEGGLVSIAAHVEAGTLVCSVTDNGPGLVGGPPRPGALGLKTVRGRLALLHPRASLDLQDTGQGTRALLSVPLAAQAPA